MTGFTTQDGARMRERVGDALVWTAVGLGGVLGFLALIIPINEYADAGYPDIVDCDVVTGQFLVPSALVLLLAIAVMIVRSKSGRRKFQWSPFILALAMLLGLLTRIPEWRHEVARAEQCN
jgi:hypothetical protein